jgi:SIR2-like domain
LNFTNESVQREYETLLKIIEKEECAIFIGAGLSKPSGYPSLQDLLHEMAKVASIDELQKKEVDKHWAEDFQVIKDKLGREEYRECLKRIFDHTKRDVPYNPILINILNIPFCAFVTTNFDPCLEFATMNLPISSGRYSYSYPNLPITKLTDKHIYHPHGYIDPEIPDSVTSIILSQDEFNDAYNVTMVTSAFFNVLFGELDVLFVGFGWNDIEILNVLEKTKHLREIGENIATKRELKLSRERYKFALIDKDTYEKDKNQENYIGKLGIIPIPYVITENNHHQLIQIIEDIQRETSKKSISPIPSVPKDFYKLPDINVGDFND